METRKLEPYMLVAENDESTVVTDFEPGYRSAAQYQSEAAMEADLIERLQRQGYEYLTIDSEAALIENLRKQLEKLNHIQFSDKEWKDFFKANIGNPNFGIEEKSAIIQEDHKKTLIREDGSMTNVYLLDKENVHNNYLQVINQYVPDGGAHANRYDVTILVNGLPLVHVELKRRGVNLKEAFNQIRRYNRDSFWAGCGLFEYAQIFVISNGTLTKYYSNTTRDAHVKQMAKASKSKKQTSNSFEFTSYWATKDNKPVEDLVDFTQTFFAKHTLLNVLTKYCVWTSEKLLLVMRPYQIAATESIIQKIKTASENKLYGSAEGGGYIWHTTGSGKTLTSFKTAQIASKMAEIDQVLFIVDRKDLDYQTMKEYDRFEKGAANSNTSTSVLKKQLDKPGNNRIIITTIQKLSNFIARNPEHPIYKRHIVLIFDECHRSQFGDMHKAVVKKFKKYHMFGFTGTPIFPENRVQTRNIEFTTTEGAFGKRLHSYTIVDAIRDANVLPFRVDYVKTMREEDDIDDEKVKSINREMALLDSKRITAVTEYILDHFNQKTKRNTQHYAFNRLVNIGEVASGKRMQGIEVKEIKTKTRLQGFNSMFAVASIPFAKAYYNEFKRQMENWTEEKKLKIATIYSYAANEAEEDFIGFGDDENNESTDNLDAPSRDFLEDCIADYNSMFGTSYDTSAEKFQNYYKDLSLRMKNREIDLLIVVNMFLTGFDATTLNTLWVDKNLRMHGLIQAYSRTNRILNSIKSFGNIVCFRNLESATNEALKLFGDKDAGGVVLLRTFDDYYYGYKDENNGREYTGYKDLAEELLAKFPIVRNHIEFSGEQAEKDFIVLFGNILRARNILEVFDQFAGKEILTWEQFLDYKSRYLDLHDKYRGQEGGDSVIINDDIVFEMELVKSVEINIDYILFLVAQKNGETAHDREIVLKIDKAVSSTPELRNKKDLIMDFVNNVTPGSAVEDDWKRYVAENLEKEVSEIITSENLKPEKTREFLTQSFRDGEVKESGTAIAAILPPMPLFGKGNDREEKKNRVIEKIKNFFARFFDICGGIFPLSKDNDQEVPKLKDTNIKENTLYLPIQQIYFDQIIAGTKTSEYRELKASTASRYLVKSRNGFELNPDTTIPGKKYELDDYNNGKFPFVVRPFKYLSLAVGYHKERDTALVEIKDVRFIPGNSFGDKTDWVLEYVLGDVISLHRK